MRGTNLVFAPASKAQEQFLNSDATITFYGGAAGAGKSHCLLGAFLKYCHHPKTRGVILRRTTKQISNPGGLFDSAVSLYKKVDPNLKIKSRELEIIFSSGAKLKFGYLAAQLMEATLCLQEQLTGGQVKKSKTLQSQHQAD